MGVFIADLTGIGIEQVGGNAGHAAAEGDGKAAGGGAGVVERGIRVRGILDVAVDGDGGQVDAVLEGAFSEGIC